MNKETQLIQDLTTWMVKEKWQMLLTEFLITHKEHLQTWADIQDTCRKEGKTSYELTTVYSIIKKGERNV